VLGEWVCGAVPQISPEEAVPAEGAALEQADDDEALRLTLQGGQWHVEFLREVG